MLETIGAQLREAGQKLKTEPTPSSRSSKAKRHLLPPQKRRSPGKVGVHVHVLPRLLQGVVLLTNVVIGFLVETRDDDPLL